MATWQPNLDPLISGIPRLSSLLRSIGDAINADLGVTAAMRGVMASLAAAGPRTVPDLARERTVSRQHIQAVVNELIAAGLSRAVANPAHRRSVLIELTDKGRQAYAQVRSREVEVMARTAPAVSAADLAAAMRLFDVLEHELAARAAEARTLADAGPA